LRHVQLCYLVQNPSIDVVFFFEGFRCSHNQRIYIIDDPADVVGNASDRIRGVRTALKSYYLKLWLSSSRLGGPRHPRCISANDDKPFF
jgi:hypothetical protein